MRKGFILVAFIVIFFCLNLFISVVRGETLSSAQNTEQDSWTIFETKMDKFEKEIQVYLGVRDVQKSIKAIGDNLTKTSAGVKTYTDVEARIQEIKGFSVGSCRLMMELTNDFSFLFSQFVQLKKQDLVVDKKMEVLEKQVQVYFGILSIQDKLNGTKEQAQKKFQTEPKPVISKTKIKRPATSYAEFETELAGSEKALVGINQTMLDLTKDFAILFLQYRDWQKQNGNGGGLKSAVPPIQDLSVPVGEPEKVVLQTEPTTIPTNMLFPIAIPVVQQVEKVEPVKEQTKNEPAKEPEKSKEPVIVKQEAKLGFVIDKDIDGLWPYLGNLAIEKTGSATVERLSEKSNKIILVSPKGGANSVKITALFSMAETTNAVNIKYSGHGWMKVNNREPDYIRDSGSKTFYFPARKQTVRLEIYNQDGEELVIGAIKAITEDDMR